MKVVWGTVRSKSDSETPGWGRKVNVWSNPTKKTNSSILARLSPMQFRRPAGESRVFYLMEKPSWNVCHGHVSVRDVAVGAGVKP